MLAVAVAAQKVTTLLAEQVALVAVDQKMVVLAAESLGKVILAVLETAAFPVVAVAGKVQLVILVVVAMVMGVLGKQTLLQVPQ